jgi:hypothetical protein
MPTPFDLEIATTSLVGSFVNSSTATLAQRVNTVTQRVAAGVSFVSVLVPQKAVVPSLAVNVAAVFTAGMALETGAAVLDDDVLGGKSTQGDVLTVLGDFVMAAAGMAGVFSITDPSPQINAVVDALKVLGSVLSIGSLYVQGQDIASAALTSKLNTNIPLVQNALSTMSTQLTTTNVPLSSQWNLFQTALTNSLNSTLTAVNNPNNATDAAAVVNSCGNFFSACDNLYNAVIASAAFTAIPASQQTSANFSVVSGYQQSGYYIVQPGDTAQSIVSALTNGGIIANGIDANALMRVNAVFGITTFTAGTLLHVPVPNASSSNSGLTQVFDPANNTRYFVGANYDGSNIGALIIDTPIAGGFTTFDAGTFSGVTAQANGQIAVSLTMPDGSALGTYAFKAGTDAGTLTFTDGMVLNVPGGLASHLTIDPAASPEATLINYLSELGVTDTSSQLDMADYNYLNPTTAPIATVTTTNLGLNSNGSENVSYAFSGGTASPNITGASTVTVGGVQHTAYNILSIGSTTSINMDFTRATLNNIQELALGGTNAAADLTQTEFAGFGQIIGSGGTIEATTSGTFNLTASNVSSAADVSLTATDWLGTTLIGNNQNNETLTASLFGNDKLQAGNGTGDILVSGDGVDTLTGGTGGDTFVVGFLAHDYNLAAGSVITGNGSSNVLQVDHNADLTGITITGVQTLSFNPLVAFAENVTLTAAELSDFSSITGANVERNTITASTGGTYSLLGKTVTGFTNLIAGSNAGTTLLGDNSAAEVLTASASGNDALTAGNGANDALIATNSSGNDTFQLGSGANQEIYVVGSTGTDTLRAGNGAGDKIYLGNGIDTATGGTGGDTFFVGGVLAAGSVITGNGGGNTLSLTLGSDISGATITGVQTLAANANVIVSAAELSEFSRITGTGSIIVGSTSYTPSTVTNANGSTTVTLTNTSTNAVAGVYVNGTGGETVAPPSGDIVGISGNGTTGAADSVALSNGTVLLQSGANAIINGSGDVVTAASNDTVNVTGTSDAISIGSGSTASISGSGNSTINAAAGDTITISGNGTGGASDYVTSSSSTVAVAANANATVIGSGNTINAGSSDRITVQGGNNDVINLGASTTLTVNNGTGDTVHEGAGESTVLGSATSGETLIASATGNNAFFNSGGADTYDFGSTFGQDTIFNLVGATGGTAKGQVNFTTGLTDEKLWFMHSGNNLVVDALGTNEQITLNGWYSGNAGSQVSSFLAGGLTLDSQVQNLVQAMATYSAANPGFNPATAAAMPTDTTLQSAIAAAWHH